LFQRVYNRGEEAKALQAADLFLGWASHGISTMLRQYRQRKVVLASYVWQLRPMPFASRLRIGLTTRIAAMWARGLVFMTTEQCEEARRFLGPRVPVVKLKCGIDTRFYQTSAMLEDTPEAYQEILAKLIRRPFFVIMGDMLRDDAALLDTLKRTGLTCVRILQDPQKAAWLRRESHARKLSERLFIFERANYLVVRFLLQHARAYAGFVDSTWQPAGWTTTCEALASGIAVVLYDGLASRELCKVGAGRFIHIVPFGDISSFRKQLESLMAKNESSLFQEEARKFAAASLDLECAGDQFVDDIEKLVTSDRHCLS
jgi:hypothetical protein